jgi:hypothetical protein
MPGIAELEGSAEVLEQLAVFTETKRQQVVAQLKLECEDILNAANQQVPWESTRLMQSGRVQPDPDNPDGFTIGYYTPYAAKQHEDLTLHHPKPGTKAKYLEDPSNAMAPLIPQHIVDAVGGIQ